MQIQTSLTSEVFCWVNNAYNKQNCFTARKYQPAYNVPVFTACVIFPTLQTWHVLLYTIIIETHGHILMHLGTQHY